MAELNYRDFDLWIGRAAEAYVAKGRDTDGREATVDARLAFSESEIGAFWVRIGRSPSRHAAGLDAGGRDYRPEAAAKRHGGLLFDAIFQGDLLNCFRRSLEQADRDGTGLRIRLRLSDVPELSDLPWEYLYDTSCDRFFALSVKTPVVRYLELPERLQTLAARPPLRMLVMVASPRGYGALNVDEEWRRMNEALGDLRAQGLIELQRLEGATLAALQRQLRRGRVHVFHFIGHGDFDGQSQEGALILADESGRGLPVTGQELGVVLHDHAPRLVVLNACEGARGSKLNPFAGVAQKLIRQGVRAAVAMQTKVLDDFALTLAYELYSALADGYPVDACLTEARKVLAGQQYPAWGAPVLYLRAPDGRILDLEAPDAGGDRAAAAAPPGPQAPVAAGKPAPARARSALRWAAAAALAFTVVLLLVYGPWRESPSRPTAVADSAATEPTEAADTETQEQTVPPPERDEPDADKGGSSDVPSPDVPPPDRSSDAPSSDVPPPAPKLEPPPEKRPPDPDPAAAWPRPDRRNAMHRNPRDGLSYAWIPAGSFMFGCSPGDELCEADEKPASRREIKAGFWLGRTEVTVGAYRRFRDHPSKLPPAPSFNLDWRDDAQPMVNVSRADAARFCEWAGARLPTEIEWEYAARAEIRSSLPPSIPEKAWFADSSGGRAHPVGLKEPNAFGLYDMLGNASEWVAQRPDLPAGRGARRGGSWNHATRSLRFSFRVPEGHSERTEMYGFRCLADV